MICNNCGAIYMEGSPFCPNCNIPIDREEEVKRTASARSKGTLSGDVLLSESKRIVIAEDGEESEESSSLEKPAESFKNKSYSLRKEDVEDAERRAKAQVEPRPFDFTDPTDLDERKEFTPDDIPEWKIKQEERKRRRNITSAHEIGTVQGGKILPPNLSPDDFMKLQGMSKVRLPYFMGIMLCYLWLCINVLINVLFIRGMFAQVFFMLFVLAMTLVIQFLRSKIACAVLVVGSLAYLWYNFSVMGGISILMLIVGGLLTLRATIWFEKLYDNYLQTQTIPDDIKVVTEPKSK